MARKRPNRARLERLARLEALLIGEPPPLDAGNGDDESLPELAQGRPSIPVTDTGRLAAELGVSRRTVESDLELLADEWAMANRRGQPLVREIIARKAEATGDQATQLGQPAAATRAFEFVAKLRGALNSQTDPSPEAEAAVMSIEEQAEAMLAALPMLLEIVGRERIAAALRWDNEDPEPGAVH